MSCAATRLLRHARDLHAWFSWAVRGAVRPGTDTGEDDAFRV